MPSIKIRLDTATKLRSGAHPVVLQITWGTHVRRKRIKGFSAQKNSWDFDNHCFLHSDKKNGMLEEYESKIRRIAQDVFPWDYREFLNRLERDENKQQAQNKKLIAFCMEYSNEQLKTRSVSYAENFKAVASLLRKCFRNDIWIQDFRHNQLIQVLQKLDEREISGYDYLRDLKIVLTEAISRSIIDAENCPIKTKYSPQGYDINQRKRCAFKRQNKRRIKDLSEEEKEMVVDFFHNAEIPPTHKKHLAYWIIGYRLFGVNLVDLAMLKWEDISNDYWKYKRSKTGIGKEGGKPLSKEVLTLLKSYDTGGYH